ncbi:hypothetical protein BDV39DRAFT_182287, partial [Aspergillus sergii]
MAPLAKTLAVAGALFAAVASAAPVQKRQDVVVSTRTTVEWTTVTVTTTITSDRPVQTRAQPTVSVPASSTPVVTPEPSQPAEVPGQFQESEAPEPQQSATIQPVWTPTPAESTTSATPTPEPTEQPEPTTTSNPPVVVPTSSSTTSAAPQPTASSSGGSGSGYTGTCSKDSPCTGQVTYYDTATSSLAPSSCGYTNDGSTEDVLALPVGMMQDSDCGRMVTVHYNGKVVSGKVVDKCMGCDSTSIDLSRHFFNSLASEDAGRLYNVEWFI